MPAGLEPADQAKEKVQVETNEKVETALEYVDNVIALKQPVPYRRYNRWVAHKSGYGPARYPTKTARYFKKTLQDAVANAEYLGRGEPEAMVIRVINAHKGSPVQGFRRRALLGFGLLFKCITPVIEGFVVIRFDFESRRVFSPACWNRSSAAAPCLVLA